MKAWLAWIDQRLPIISAWQQQLLGYRVPNNLNFWYLFGVLSLVVLANQLLTGLWLAMYYQPSADHAFDSIQFIMRDVKWGWLLRYLHTTGASAFFIVIYLHMFRALWYGSYQQPRELVWLLGMVLYWLLLAEAFLGYLLPWGQMSYWGAQVITSLVSAVPYVGDSLVVWLRGDYAVSTATLNRFYALHIMAVPLLLGVIVRLHLKALHHVGSNNPTGKDLPSAAYIPFHPVYTLKDTLAVIVFLMVLMSIVCFAPSFWGLFLEPNNAVPANPLQTPAEISPMWYLTPFYAMLRAIPNKGAGVSLMIGAIIGLACLPWLDSSPIRAMKYRSWLSRSLLALFMVAVLALGYLGRLPVTAFTTLWARIFTAGYFSFLILLPLASRMDKRKEKG